MDNVYQSRFFVLDANSLTYFKKITVSDRKYIHVHACTCIIDMAGGRRYMYCWHGRKQEVLLLVWQESFELYVLARGFFFANGRLSCRTIK